MECARRGSSVRPRFSDTIVNTLTTVYFPVDLSSSATTEETRLIDNDDSTCIGNAAKTSVTFNFTDMVVVEFVRIVVNDVGFRDTIGVSYMNADKEIKCSRLKRLEINPTTSEIYCSQPVATTVFVLTGTGVKHLCTVSLSAGRDLALKTTTSSSLVEAQMVSDYAVDFDVNSLTCFQTQVSLTSKVFLNVDFPFPFSLFKIVLRNYREGLYDMLNNFTIQYNDRDAKAITNEQIRYMVAKREYSILPKVNVSQLVKNIQILSEDKSVVQNGYVLSVCLFQALGGCPPGGSGLDCSTDCSHCAGKECNIIGLCYNCTTRNNVTSCKRSCGNCGGDGSCDVNTGVCKHECKPGFKGLMCHQQCLNCGGNKACDRQHGYCNQGCAGKFTGPACTEREVST
ncbi:uncharacterized protein LOC131941120 [Physella acuta]|uniref:uncharacterized protein LOC131941120 n=1 Tax=Physella acuta TaxID=109671 RepID=UPI0027DD52F2|nr:uncharacterized protein LOC131941120 [Physella acuta]